MLIDTHLSKKPGIYGRKIFFLYPGFALNTNIILRLREQEFELYKLEEYRKLKCLLEKYPDSIVLINLDSQNSINVWFNFIKYFEQSPKFSHVSFGVLTDKIREADEERYTKALKLEAGFYSLSKTFGEIMDCLMIKLEELKAKGCRQFLSMNCAEDKGSECYFVSGNMMYKMKLLDISSIGLGMKVPGKYVQVMKPDSVIRGLTLVLGTKQLKVNARIHATRPEEDGVYALLIFTPETPDNFRNFVRNYIYEEIQQRLGAECLSLEWDKNEYVIAPPEE